MFLRFAHVVIFVSCSMALCFSLHLGYAVSFASNQSEAEVFAPAHIGASTVTLYPQSALVSTEIVLHPEHAQVHIVLPPMADTASFTFHASGRRVVAIEERRQGATPLGSMADLMQSRQDLLDGLALLKVEEEGLKAQKSFWDKADPNALMKDKDIEKLEKTIQQRHENLALAFLALEHQQVTMKQNLVDIEGHIKRMGGSIFLAANGQNTGATVPVMVVHFDADAIPKVPDDAEHDKLLLNMVNLSTSYSYILRDCSWTPHYRFEALLGHEQGADAGPSAHEGIEPNAQQGEVLFQITADMMQKSGAPWEDVHLSLASISPSRRVSPVDLRPWFVGPIEQRERVAPRMANNAMADGLPLMQGVKAAPSMSEGVAGNTPPSLRHGANHSLWDLGTQSLQAGESKSVSLETGSWPAIFRRLIRPALDSHAYLRAEISLPEGQSLAPAKALYLVEGTVLGEQSIAPQGRDITLYFGQDAKVYATMKNTMAQEGKGSHKGTQRHIWTWQIEVHNEHDSPVAVRVEDPAPQLRHEDISLDVQSKPSPERHDNALYWDILVPAHGSVPIEHIISITAPEDMPLQTGRAVF